MPTLCQHYGMTQNKIKIFLEVAKTNIVVVRTPKLFLASEQVHDELVNVNEKQTNLEGGVVESASFGVFSQKQTAGLLYL